MPSYQRIHHADIPSLRLRCDYEPRSSSKRARPAGAFFLILLIHHEVLVALRVLRLDCPAGRDRQLQASGPAALPPLVPIHPSLPHRPGPGCRKRGLGLLIFVSNTEQNTHLPVAPHILQRTPAHPPMHPIGCTGRDRARAKTQAESFICVH